MTDHLSAHGARCLAASITSYWKSKGYSGIKVSVSPINQAELDYPQIQETYIIRSNIGPTGYPPQ